MCATAVSHGHSFFEADSKVLSEEKREELFRCIDSSSHLLGWRVEILSPNDISNCMLHRYIGWMYSFVSCSYILIFSSAGQSII